MYLKQVYVRWFRSYNFDYLRKSDLRASPSPWDMETVDGFDPFIKISLERDITTIVGANESGKSQLLSAISILLDDDEVQHRDFCRFSDRFVTDDNMLLPEFGAEFSGFSDEDKERLATLLDLSNQEVPSSLHLFKTNANMKLFFSIDGEWRNLEIDRDTAIGMRLPSVFKINAETPIPNSVPLSFLTTGNIEGPSSRIALWKRDERLRNSNKDLNSYLKNPQQHAEAIRELVLVSDIGKNEKEELKSQYSLAKTMLIDVAGISPVAFEELYASVASSDGYANGLVERMNQQLSSALNLQKWWSQDSEFALMLTLRDFDLVFTIRDRTGTNYSFSERSGGLKYFLSYLVQHLAHQPAPSEILLMDEPDAYLSASGQQDLMRIFESRVGQGNAANQIVYVTHSPYLIDRNHSDRVRVLVKGEMSEGTRVVNNAGKTHYEPLRTSIGPLVGELTFIGNTNLIVEGQADQLYLARFSELVRRHLSVVNVLDLNALTIVPAGSASAVPYMVYLARGRDTEKPTVLVLLDDDSAGEDARRKLKKPFGKGHLIDDRFILSFSGLAFNELALDVRAIKEIEDLIPKKIASAAVLRYAREVLSPNEFTSFEQSFDPVNPNGSESLFEAAERASDIPLDASNNKLDLDKVGFARGVVQEVFEAPDGEAQQIALKNFSHLFSYIEAARRDAERLENTVRLTTLLKRATKAFFRDNPQVVRKSDLLILIEDIEYELKSYGSLGEHILSALPELSKHFQLTSDTDGNIEDVDNLIKRLDDVIYSADRNVQVPQGNTTLA